MPEIKTDVSRQSKPVALQRPTSYKMWSARTRLGALTSSQMRRLGAEGIPGLCKSTLIDQSVAGLNWEILNSSGERDANTEFYTMLLEQANDGEGFGSFVSRVSDDILTTLGGGLFEVVLSPDEIPVALYNVDSVTMHRTYDAEKPWVQRVGSLPPVFFNNNEMAQLLWHPRAVMGETELNVTPIQLAYMYICILASADDWNLELLSDPFPAGVLSLPGATEEEAAAFQKSWDYAIQGGSLRDLAVIYGLDLKQAQHIKFTRPPTDMAFEITNHWYASLVAAAFEMSVLDISILTKVSTKAGAESQAEQSSQQGQRKLRKLTADSFANWILPEGYTFNWIVPKPEDEETQAAALERRARATFYLVQAFGPEIGQAMATDMGLISGGKPQPPEHLKSSVADMVIKSDLKGVMSFSDWEMIQNATVYKSEEPPEDLWGKALLAWILLQYRNELASALEICLYEMEEDEEAALSAFEASYTNSLKRASARAFVAGKQDDAKDLVAALAIAALAFTVVELAQIDEEVTRDQDYFKGFIEKLKEEGPEYGRAAARTDLYSKLPRKLYNMGVVASMDPEVDMVEILYGGSENPCSECPSRWGVWTFEEYNRMGGPSQNWCLGHNNCHCLTRIKRGARKY